MVFFFLNSPEHGAFSDHGCKKELRSIPKHTTMLLPDLVSIFETAKSLSISSSRSLHTHRDDPVFANPYLVYRPPTPEYGAIDAEEHENQPPEDHFSTKDQKSFHFYVQMASLEERQVQKECTNGPELDAAFQNRLLRGLFLEVFRNQHKMWKRVSEREVMGHYLHILDPLIEETD